MFKRFIVLTIALAGLAGGASADQNAENLDSLFRELAAAEYPITAQQVESEIWRAWLRIDDQEVDKEMKAGIRAMSTGRIDESIRHFTDVVEHAPGFAEGWNKRATAHYLNDELVKSMRDIQKTLELEPRHFGAISGMGLIFLKRGDERGALDAFEEVLKIYPMAPGAGKHVERLREKLQGQGV